MASMRRALSPVQRLERRVQRLGVVRLETLHDPAAANRHNNGGHVVHAKLAE
jgi:hypothetical protein